MKPSSKQMLLAALQEFGRCDVTVEGESMKPFIRSGDTATIVAVSSSPRLGQIAVFFNGEQLIMHRIAGREKKHDGTWELLVYGDSSPRSGGTVNSSRVIGVVLHVYRNDGIHALWFSLPFRLLAVGIGFLLRLWVIRTTFRRPHR